MYGAFRRTPADERYSELIDQIQAEAPHTQALLFELDEVVGERLIAWTDHAARWVASQPRTSWERTVTARLDALEARS